MSDHYAIAPRLGSSGDFTEFMRTATDRGMRVIVDVGRHGFSWVRLA